MQSSHGKGPRGRRFGPGPERAINMISSAYTIDSALVEVLQISAANRVIASSPGSAAASARRYCSIARRRRVSALARAGEDRVIYVKTRRREDPRLCNFSVSGSARWFSQTADSAGVPAASSLWVKTQWEVWGISPRQVLWHCDLRISAPPARGARSMFRTPQARWPMHRAQPSMRRSAACATQ